MATGVCCHWIEQKTHPKSGKVENINIFEERTLQLGRYRQGKYSDEAIKATYVHNVKRLSEMLPRIYASGVSLFRMSSAMFPLSDQVDRSLWDNDEVKTYLAKSGKFIQDKNMRVTTHPGQFCVLSSDEDSIVEKSFIELEIHGWLFDSMGLEESTKFAINIHGGKADRMSRLVDHIKSLPDSIRKRLTLENDECSYNVLDLLPVYLETNVPIVFDSHHHVFNNGDLSMEDAFSASSETWPKGIKPLQHLSNTEPHLVNGNFQDRRKHSDMIHYVPDIQLQGMRDDTVDVEVEAKMKNYSTFDLRKQFSISS